MVTVLMGRGTVLENCTCGIPVVNPTSQACLPLVRHSIEEACPTLEQPQKVT